MCSSKSCTMRCSHMLCTKPTAELGLAGNLTANDSECFSRVISQCSFIKCNNDMPQILTYIVFIFLKQQQHDFHHWQRLAKNKSRPGSRKQSTFPAQKQWLERAERIGNRKEEFPAILGAVKHQTCLENAISDPKKGAPVSNMPKLKFLPSVTKSKLDVENAGNTTF